MNFVFQHAFYCLHVYHCSLRFICDKATMAKEKEYLRYFFYSSALPKETKKVILPRPDRMHHIVEDFLTLW